MGKDNITTRVKKGVYGLAAKIGKDVREKSGVVGKIADVVEATGEAVKELAKEGVKTGKSMHEDIQKSGGYIKAAKRTGKSFADSAKSVYNSTHRVLEDNFYTEGKFDPKKAERILDNQTDAIKKYGKKAYDKLSEIVSSGTGAIREDFRKYIPTDEELKTKYSGIGEKYNGILFREHYDKCILFSKKAEKKIPKGTRYKAQILADIKDSASGNADELVKFYINRKNFKKIKVAEKFLYLLHK